VTSLSRASVDPTPIASDPTAWDAMVLANGGHMLQSWRWGALKSHFGWEVERITSEDSHGTDLAQVLFRQKFGLSVGYLPRGPVLSSANPTGLARLFARIDAVAKRRRALTIIVEPEGAIDGDQAPPTLAQSPLLPIQPARTVKISLDDDESLLAQMHQKTRYNVRLAQRRGVQTRFVEATDASVATFYELLQDTAARNAFGIHTLDYYQQFLRLFGDDATLIFAEIDALPVAGIIAAAFGPEAIYMYGASSTKHRAHGAGFLIQFEAMRWARERGCLRYDLWGIPAQDPHSTKVDDGDRIAGTAGSDWRGLYEFKTRFGGEIVSYSPPFERQYHPLMTSLARRFYQVRG
jgi:lipid II:glycine glycyltransferase (peptidoglycan interpeptide bridge formation enzyme)